jgi:glycosyltransferase involved in cell wall biosynthesis
MERHLAASPVRPGDLTSEAMLALRGARASGQRPILLGFVPHFRTNPFQALLYSRCREHGLLPLGIDDFDQVPELTALQRAGIETVLHVHWLHPVTVRAESEGEAAARIAAFLDLVDAHRAAGGRLAWTVHNVLPHDARFEELEARFSQEVARRCDVIHVLVEGTADHVAPQFSLPRDRLLHVPHPSYLGAYEDHVSRPDARHSLGIMPDEFVFVVAGAIKAYKGLAGLLDAWQTLETDRPMRLVIAGAPGTEAGIDGIVARAILDPTILIDPRRIPASEMQLFMRAADVAILPYLRSLNSGALALALTFGLPVIVPAGGALAEVVDAGFARTVQADSPAALRAAILDAPRWVTPRARRAARAHAEMLTPAVVAERFAVDFRERLGRPAAAAVA